jgi:hypothetical protein
MRRSLFIVLGFAPMIALAIASAQQPAKQAKKAKARQITVYGTCIDDKTTKPVTRFVIQGGLIDKDEPSKYNWGYHETRGGPNTEGRFSTSLNIGEGWTGRILAEGYLPEFILLDPPPEGQNEVHLTYRMRKGRTIRGRVFDFEARPVAGATVFAVPPVSISLRGGKAVHTHDDSLDPLHLGVKTDEEGRFELTATAHTSLAVSTKEVDAWAAPMPVDDTEAIIRLPKMPRIEAALDIDGTDDDGRIFHQLLTHEMPGWDHVQVHGTMPIRNRGKLTITSLPPGKYQFCRYRQAGGYGLMLDRQYVDLKHGDTIKLDFVRPRGQQLTGTVTWPKSVEMESVIVAVYPVSEKKEPLTFLREKCADALLCGKRKATAEDEGAPDYSGHKTTFRTERISPGEYEVVAEAHAKPPKQKDDEGGPERTGLRAAGWTATLVVTVSESGEATPLALELKNAR